VYLGVFLTAFDFSFSYVIPPNPSFSPLIPSNAESPSLSLSFYILAFFEYATSTTVAAGGERGIAGV